MTDGDASPPRASGIRGDDGKEDGQYASAREKHVGRCWSRARGLDGGGRDGEDRIVVLDDDTSTPLFLYHGCDDEVVPFTHLGLYTKKIAARDRARTESRTQKAALLGVDLR